MPFSHRGWGLHSLLGREDGTCSADRFTARSGGPHEYMVAQAFLTEPIRWAHLYFIQFQDADSGSYGRGWWGLLGLCRVPGAERSRKIILMKAL